jgi:amino acid adenylation domain-containing protein
MVTHRGVVNCIAWMQQAYALKQQDRMLCKTTLNFDPSVWEVFWPLLAGAQIVLSKPGEQQNVAALLETIVREQVTIAYFVPSLLSLLLAEEELEQAVTLKQVICGGESLPNDLVKLFYERLPHATVHHSYGPTETAIASSEIVCERNSTYPVTPIGRPLANTQLYVLDQQQQPVPIGVLGELYIGGSGLGRGYLNQPALTATKFVPDLFSTEPGRRLYRTGDMVRYLADGNLEFHGRRDEQVKLRGVRIELGEIENVIRAQEGVRAAIVMMRADALVAYVVAEDGLRVTSSELRHAIAQQLPVSMIPAAFVLLAEIPLLPNGKIDRAALPEPEAEAETYVAPRDEVETLIAGVWADVLDRERVSVHDDFFALGGDSLTATQVMARLFDVFHVDLGLRSLFEASTVAGLAEIVSSAVCGGTFSQPLALIPHTRPEVLPLSFAQQRLWFLEQMESAGAYRIPVIFRIRGRLDVPVLERVIDEIARRHESLRTTFDVVAGEPVQVISPPRHVPLPIINLSELPEDQREAEAVLLSSEQAQLQFDLTTGPLLQARLVRLSKEEHVLQVTLHHLIADGWSVGVLARETRALYEAFIEDNSSPLPELPAQYADFALWQREWLQGELLESQVAYWREQLAGAPTALELPTDHMRPPVQSFAGGEIKFEFPASLTEALHKLSRREGATIFMTLLTAFSVLLSRYAGEEDVVVGTPIANRRQSELEELIGFFANTLALRVDVQPELTFRELLRNVRETTLNAYANQDVPFERLVEELQPPRELNRSPLFQVLLDVQNTSHSKLILPELEIGIQEYVTNSTRFDLECFLKEEDGRMLGHVIYSSDLFEQQTIEKMLQHFRRLLELVIEDPKQQISDLRFLTPEEDHQQLVEWNNTKTDYPREKCVHELFEEQVARTPSNIAIEFGDQRLSYSELNRQAGEIAARLRKVGVGPNTIVGICLERSPAMLIALLGVLKAGGAYLPLDPAYPKTRLAYMLDDSGSAVLITHTNLRDRFAVLPERVLYVDDHHSHGSEIASVKVTPDDLLYVIYTSGSTGTPKGVAMPHRSLVNLITWQIARSGRPAPRTLQFASFSFDVSFQETFSTWCAGGTLILIDEEVRRDVERLWSTLARKGVERLFLPCVALQGLAEVCIRNKSVVPRLREVVSGGEQLKITPQIRELFARLNGCLFDNHYGPTETHAMTAYRLPRDETSWPDIGPIGRAISNTQMYVLDPQLKPGPVGVIGEVCLSGDSLSLGYLNRPEATAEKYIPNPFSDSPGARMYRTGDLARLLSDGNVEFFGRRDGQLKIRGYRVEIGEIESVLAGHPSINEAIVVAKKGESGAVRLVAYARVREALAWTELRPYLKERLPEYMIPASFVTVEKFPLTPSGKIDRRSLSLLTDHSVEEELPTEALSPTAELLTGIWAEVLEVEHVNAHDNFFDLSGHSLLATRVISRIREAFNLELPLRRLFEYPTVLELSAHIDEQLRVGEASALSPIQPQPHELTRPLSFAQQRIWYWEQLQPGTPTYNLTSALRLEGELDLAVFERSLNEVVRRHETLRTSFTAIDGQAVQVVAPRKTFRVSFTDLSSMPVPEGEAEARRLAGIDALRPFSLAKSPLLRVSLLRLSQQEHIAVVSMHHSISDGWSIHLLIEEVTTLYEAYRSGKPSPLPDLPVQYGDFAHWQNELLKPGSAVLESQLAYWKEQLRDVAELKLPLDRPRPAVYDPRGALMPLHYSAELSQALKKLSRREDVTLFMTLLSAFNVLLHSQSGQEDIVVGAPIANRTRVEMEKLIGFFVNMLVLRTDLSGDPTFRELLQRTREVMIGAYAHQDVPFAKLVGELNVKRDASRNPLFQVAYIFDNTSAQTPELSGLKFSQFNFEVNTAPFDLSLFLTETADGLRGSVMYNTALFEEQTIRRLLDHHETLLERVVADPNQRLSSFNFLAKALAG